MNAVWRVSVFGSPWCESPKTTPKTAASASNSVSVDASSKDSETVVSLALWILKPADKALLTKVSALSTWIESVSKKVALTPYPAAFSPAWSREVIACTRVA